MHRSRVLFPEPDGPMIEITSPRFAMSDTFFSTQFVPKLFLMSWISSAFTIGIPIETITASVTSASYDASSDGSHIFCVIPYEVKIFSIVPSSRISSTFSSMTAASSSPHTLLATA
jgi:hypothetical protein